MTAHSALSAPTPNVTFEENDDDSDAAQETEAFLASLMEESYANEDDAYLPPDNAPVRAYANMLSSDDIWILATDKSGKDVVPDLPGMGRGERISISLPAIPAIAHDTFWEMEHAKLQEDRDEFADAVPSPQELEAQFVQWEKTRMNAYLATRKRSNLKKQNESDRTKQQSPQQSSSVFDDAYVDGTRQIIPAIPKEIPLSYAKAFAAELSSSLQQISIGTKIGYTRTDEHLLLFAVALSSPCDRCPQISTSRNSTLLIYLPQTETL
jgi:hypothetical protein